jgi:CheY-like chemotaxis protein
MSNMPRPNVYFIDDSATMREIVKTAFLRENISVVTCHDASIALAEIELAPPDVVISDIIMPGKDGYEVCRFIKQHPLLNKMPVILMSGLVDRTVAEKAAAVKADELIRKPFQPRDLINRVKALLNPGEAPAVPAPAAPQPAAAAAPAVAHDLGSDKLRAEVQRLQVLVKKLQAELEAEREYGRALEAQIKSLQGGE